MSALLSILRRYNWQHFGILTSEIAGHDDFVQAVRDRIAHGAEGEEEEYKSEDEAGNNYRFPTI